MGPATGPASSASDKSPAVQRSFEDFLREAVEGGGPGAGSSAPHLGQFLIAAMRAFDSTPLGGPKPPGNLDGLGGSVCVFFRTPGFLAQATQPGFDKRLASPEGRFRIQRFGDRRIRIEHWQSRVDSAFHGLKQW